MKDELVVACAIAGWVQWRCGSEGGLPRVETNRLLPRLVLFMPGVGWLGVLFLGMTMQGVNKEAAAGRASGLRN